MIYQIELNDLKNIFQIDENLSNLENIVNNTAPSILDYHLETLIGYADEILHFNRFNIEYAFELSSFKLYLDYDKKYYLEKDTSCEEEYIPLF